MSRIEAWLVDLDGTLYRPLPVKLAMAVELGLGGWSAAGALRHFRHEHEAVRASGEAFSPSPFAEQVRRTQRRTGHAPEVIEALVVEWMQRRPGKWIWRFRRTALLEEIGAFRQAGGRTALVSDYPARMKLEALGAEMLFEEIVASGEPGGPARLKPHPEGYLAAAARLGVTPAACLVIGDREDADGAAARAAGMQFRLIG